MMFNLDKNKQNNPLPKKSKNKQTKRKNNQQNKKKKGYVLFRPIKCPP